MNTRDKSLWPGNQEFVLVVVRRRRRIRRASISGPTPRGTESAIITSLGSRRTGGTIITTLSIILTSLGSRKTGGLIIITTQSARRPRDNSTGLCSRLQQQNVKTSPGPPRGVMVPLVLLVHPDPPWSPFLLKFEKVLIRMDRSGSGGPRGPRPPLVDQERSGPPWTTL